MADEKSGGKNISVKWFIWSVVVAIILSVILSMLVVNIVESARASTGKDVTINIQQNSTDTGIIKVRINNNEVNVTQ